MIFWSFRAIISTDFWPTSAYGKYSNMIFFWKNIFFFDLLDAFEANLFLFNKCCLHFYEVILIFLWDNFFGFLKTRRLILSAHWWRMSLLKFLWFLVIWIFLKINTKYWKKIITFFVQINFHFLRWAIRLNPSTFSSMNQFYVDFMIEIRRSQKLWIVWRTSLRCKSTNFMIICFLSC